MKLIDILEYAVLLAFIYTFLYGPVTGKLFIMYVSVLGFFIFSGASWFVSADTPVVKEYKRYAIFIEAIAVLIGLIMMAYVWLF